MAQVTKITFSKAELNLLTQPDFFFLKHSATQKVMELFSALELQLKKDISRYKFLERHTETGIGKIFRGESYRTLPYIVLDYPKKFSADSIFTFRTMFWWGKEFSFTLHLQGHSFDHFRDKLANIDQLRQKEFFFCVNSKQWEYYFEDDNYKSLDEILIPPGNLNEKYLSKNFIKLSRKLPVDQYERVTEYGTETFEMLMKMLG